MNLLDLIGKRCSVRKYSDTPVEEEKIEYLLEAARLAPSAVNLQPWYFLVVKEPDGCRKIQACYSREWIRSAGCFIIVCGDHSQSWKRSDQKDHMDIDAAIAAEHICLAATELGLGSCWVCNFDAAQFKQSFNIPETIEPVVIIPIGYPDSPSVFEETPKKRKSMNEIVKRETF